ncbi:RlpA-like double-psi beta-barrel domain protein [Kalmanozyma brasiliensis GHG001]|uniref:RlpA-like protein double-psi beta-barrel domain-containing protein n=1 Tax=Kalmanozyma brasiliensis (strain GHG001) TaxID=1365824 RepID=V5ECW9_KALBG|nr:RlpA-like double-psi beta-barrel domain protein [Kalmanozyma brasiliensis GHG001]EST08301.1 RlpA-like double-psi beta-barrel domain protein [Kalmanozyma brasiliensis GHG001]
MVSFRIYPIIAVLVTAVSLVSLSTARPIRSTSIHARAGGNVIHGHRQTPIHIHRRNDHGDVTSHDGYESQLHALEAALKHYEEYGDAESLKTYLKGFTGGSDAGKGNNGDGGDAAKNSPQAAPKEDEKPNQDQSGNNAAKNSPQETPKDDKKEDKKEDKDQSGDKQKQQQQSQPQQQQQQQQQSEQPSEDDCEDDDHSDDIQAPQPKPQPQPQSQPKMVKQPKPQSQSYTSPSSNSSDASNSINGYTIPSFTTDSAPSTISLYTASPFSGRATFYNTGLGACGITNADNDPIVAISRDLFEQYNPSDGNPNNNSLCGKKVEISWNGKKAYAFATDECPGCEKTSLDCSPGVFEQLDNKDKGVLDGISWRFV